MRDGSLYIFKEIKVKILELSHSFVPQKKDLLQLKMEVLRQKDKNTPFNVLDRLLVFFENAIIKYLCNTTKKIIETNNILTPLTLSIDISP